MNVRGYFGEGQIIAPPQVSAPASPVMGFVVCPLALQGSFENMCNIEALYRLAYERAQAALCPTWYERLYRASSN